jgi:Flp pilus assembly pilin Flp
MRKGQTIVEYALILAVLTVVFIAAFSLLSQELIRIFSVITTMLDSAQSSTF